MNPARSISASVSTWKLETDNIYATEFCRNSTFRRNLMSNMNLKTRVALFTMAIFLCSVWGLAWHQSDNLREEFEKLLFDQQFAKVTYIANSIDDALKSRLYALTTIAETITPELLRQPEKIQAYLESQKPLGRTFSLGMYVISSDGKGIADFPVMEGRAKADYSQREYFREVIATGKPIIGKPVVGRFSREPVLLISVPIMDRSKKVTGVLVGANRIHGSDLFNEVQASNLKRYGDIHIVSPTYRIFIASTDPTRVLQPIAAPGVNKMLDRYLQGYDGSGLMINSSGIESLSSSSHIGTTGWIVECTLPTSIAYSPIKSQQIDIYKDTALISLAIALIVALFLRWQLAPLRSTALVFYEMANGQSTHLAVPVVGAPELRQLFESFNILRQKLAEKDEARLLAEKKLQDNNIQLELEIVERRAIEEEMHEKALLLENEMADSQKYVEKLRHQAIEMIENEKRLIEEHDHLLATEEMLRVQIDEYEISQKLLKESYDRFRALHEASFGGLFVHENGIILDCNQGLSEMTGYSVDELIGMKSIELIPEEYRDDVARKIREGFAESYEVEGIRKDGTRYHVRIRGKSISYMGHSVRVTDFRDITDRKQAEEERLKLEQQFQHAQKLESLGVLAGGIAHDFNNILTVIMVNCFMGKELPPSEQNYQARFDSIENAAHRAADLCRQMLTYAGKNALERTRINICLLVDEIVKMLRSAIRKNVAIELDLHRDVPGIIGDNAQIQQIVMNLVINAADAIGDKNGTIRVATSKCEIPLPLPSPPPSGEGADSFPRRVEIRRGENVNLTDYFGVPIPYGTYSCLEVSDTGCGMDEATQKRIFEPFFTTKFTGRGLGMSAILGIIKTHNGALQMKSAPGVGTTFKVFFPLQDLTEETEMTPATPVDGSLPGGTVMLVEDEEILRCLGESLLEEIGFSVLTAQHGLEALEIFRERSGEIDVILLDLTMPVMGGLEAYHELRNISPTVPIIICSGYSIDEIDGTIANDPHASFIQKPYRPALLQNALVAVMKG